MIISKVYCSSCERFYEDAQLLTQTKLDGNVKKPCPASHEIKTSMEALYRDKAEYYEKAFLLLADAMVEKDNLCFSEERGYYCPYSGKTLSEMLEEAG